MKRLILALSLIAVSVMASAQIKSDADIQKAIAKAEAAVAKKADNTGNWIKLGQAYLNAYNNPTANVVGGDKQQLQLVMGNDKPVSSEQVVLGNQPYEKVVYNQKNLYFDANGNLAIVEVTKPSYEGDALAKALEAYKKAAETDVKGKKTKDIAEAIRQISSNYNQDAFNAYYLGDARKASDYFALSADALLTAPVSAVDTSSIYYAGITSLEAQDYAKAEGFFKKALGYDYFSDGAVYANLYECRFAQKDTLAAREYLETGFSKFPENPQVLTNLINLYITINEDPLKLIDLLAKAKEELPDNASLYYVEGDIYARMKDYDNAVASYRKANEIDPKYEMGFYGEGVLWYNRALEIQEEANALPYSEYKKYDALQDELKVTLKKCIEPFEKCFELTAHDAVKTNVADYLKRIYFIFRSESPENQAAYDKYNSFLEGTK